MSVFTLYLLFSLLPSLDWAAGLVMAVSAVLFIAMCIAWVITHIECYDDEEKKQILANTRKGMKISFIVLCSFLTVRVLVPNENAIYTIAGGYIATNTKGMAKLPENLVGAANDYLEKLRKQIVKDTD